MKQIVLLILLSLSTFAQADTIFRIEPSKSYKGSSNEELRRRVWELERAVSQLQSQVFQLAMKDGSSGGGSGNWTCHMESFGKTLISSGNTKASALAQVLKKCGDATNPVHCSESAVKCDNE